MSERISALTRVFRSALSDLDHIRDIALNHAQQSLNHQNQPMISHHSSEHEYAEAYQHIHLDPAAPRRSTSNQ